jgi:hypothetical protein
VHDACRAALRYLSTEILGRGLFLAMCMYGGGSLCIPVIYKPLRLPVDVSLRYVAAELVLREC